MQYMFLRDLVGTINQDDQIANYEAISDALHYLNKEGQTDLDNLKMGYLRKTLTQNELRFMNWHLHKCADCRKDLKFKAVVRNGLRARKKAAELLVEEAQAHQEKGNIEAAKKCLKEALELRPWDEEIKGKLSELSGQQDGGSISISAKFRRLVKEFFILTSRAHLLFGTNPFEPVPVRRDGLQGDTYGLGERILISVESPEKRDGFLTVFHYDDDYNLSMIFPDKPDVDTLLKAGMEKRIGIQAAKPIGKHYLKAVWTSKQIIGPEQIRSEGEPETAALIETFLVSVRDLRSDDWIESVSEFEVTEK